MSKHKHNKPMNFQASHDEDTKAPIIGLRKIEKHFPDYIKKNLEAHNQKIIKKSNN